MNQTIKLRRELKNKKNMQQMPKMIFNQTNKKMKKWEDQERKRWSLIAHIQTDHITPKECAITAITHMAETLLLQLANIPAKWTMLKDYAKTVIWIHTIESKRKKSWISNQ